MSENDKMKHCLRVTMNALCELAYQWNLLSDDGDRGIGNDAIALILYDDGSGKACTYWAGSDPVHDQLNTQIPFDNIEEGIADLAQWIGKGE